MVSTTEIQYISDAEGKDVGVIVPIALWREIESERETAYLLHTLLVLLEYRHLKQ